MKSKILIIFIIILTLFLAISSISASENVTDVVGMNENLQEVVDLDEESESLISEDEPPEYDDKLPTTITASEVVTYNDVEDKFTVKLTSNNTNLVNKTVKIIFNQQTYEEYTDSNGEVRINFKLKTGTYDVQYFFLGDDNYTSSSGNSAITVKPNIETHLNVVNKDAKYVDGSNIVIKLKLTDDDGNAVRGQYVSIKIDRTYTAKTDSNGIATFTLKLKEGVYTVQYSFSKTGKYASTSGSYKITVKPNLSNGNGYWVTMWDMKKVNLKKLSKKGTKHIFLLHSVFSHYGKSAVVKWIKTAHKYGMKVHIWIAVFFKNGKFIHPSSKGGKINYKHMNKVIKKAKSYVSTGVVDGIHFDYIRFPGTAYKYKNAVKAINYFTKKASNTLHNKKPNIIVSAAVMAEPLAMKHYYGQDIPTMSKYLDVIVPMVYKGNYHASSKWIKKTTKKFVKMSKGAKIWSGLQSYVSDSNLHKRSYKDLFNDAKNAKKGGASGIILFRWGMSKLINFKKL